MSTSLGDAGSIPILVVDDMVVEFVQRGRGKPTFRAVDGVSFAIERGETVGLVGESGSGKSTIGRAILGLLPVAAGQIVFEGKDISRAGASDRRGIAAELQVVFQDPYGSLDPLRTVGQSIGEPLGVQRMSRTDIQRTVSDLLARVRLPAGSSDGYPAQFSGGQRQRIAIARALGVGPRLVVCDEPISSLDLSMQAQILNLLKEIQGDSGLAYLFIAHDLVAVRHLSRRVVVLYRGRVMEGGPASLVCDDPWHPYSRALWAAAPVPDPIDQARRRTARALTVAVNEPPADANMGDSCPFARRCPRSAPVCWTRRPVDTAIAGRTLACHLFDDGSGHPGSAMTLAQIAEGLEVPLVVQPAMPTPPRRTR